MSDSAIYEVFASSIRSLFSADGKLNMAAVQWVWRG
jgi:hypothetical protein